MNLEYVLCPKCNRILDFFSNVKDLKGTGVVYTCSCGHKTGIKKNKQVRQKIEKR